MEKNKFVLAAEHYHENLLIKLLESIPALIEKLSPGGVENCIYTEFCNDPIEYWYEYYRNERIARYRRKKHSQKGTLFHFPEKKSFEQFKASYIPWISQFQAFADLLVGEFYYLCSVENYIYKDGEVYFYDRIYDIQDSAELITDTLGLIPGKRHHTSNRIEREKADNKEINLDGFHRHIFELLRNEGIEWIYRSAFLDYILFMEQMGEEPEEILTDASWSEIFVRKYWQFRKVRYEELTHSAHFTRFASAEARKYKDTNPAFEDVFYEVANREPSNELLLYKEVNGHWPAGYPLIMSNYI